MCIWFHKVDVGHHGTAVLPMCSVGSTPQTYAQHVYIHLGLPSSRLLWQHFSPYTHSIHIWSFKGVSYKYMDDANELCSVFRKCHAEVWTKGFGSFVYRQSSELYSTAWTCLHIRVEGSFNTLVCPYWSALFQSTCRGPYIHMYVLGISGNMCFSTCTYICIYMYIMLIVWLKTVCGRK